MALVPRRPRARYAVLANAVRKPAPRLIALRIARPARPHGCSAAISCGYIGNKKFLLAILSVLIARGGGVEESAANEDITTYGMTLTL